MKWKGKISKKENYPLLLFKEKLHIPTSIIITSLPRNTKSAITATAKANSVRLKWMNLHKWKGKGLAMSVEKWTHKRIMIVSANNWRQVILTVILPLYFVFNNSLFRFCFLLVILHNYEILIFEFPLSLLSIQATYSPWLIRKGAFRLSNL